MIDQSSYVSAMIGKKAIITTDEWFYAPCGGQYRAVFGTVHAIESSEETLGIKTNARSTNWYVRIGRMIVAGCRVHYIVATDECPPGEIKDVDITNGEVKSITRPTHVYNAD